MDFTKQEIVHYVTLFFYNWSKEDFLKIWEDSDLGNTYFWDKLQYKIKDSEMNSTEAMLDMFLNMEAKNQELLIDYVLNRDTEVILRQRAFRAKIEAIRKELRKKEGGVV